jgi:hypothetical protein
VLLFSKMDHWDEISWKGKEGEGEG